MVLLRSHGYDSLRASRWFLVCVLAFGSVACGDDDAPQDGGPSDGGPDASTRDAGPDTSGMGLDAGADGEVDAGPEGLTWTTCPWVSMPAPGQPNPNGECATLEVPVNWDAPGRTLTIDIRRLPSLDPTATDLIMLNGGPGGSAATYERLTASLNNVWRDVRPVLVDARGAGRSSRLGCSAEGVDTPGGSAIVAEEWDGCLADLETEWGDDLDHFNTTQSARDLLAVAEAIAEDGVNQVAYGASYGTYWINRALQLDPDAFDAVVLDGIVDAENADLSSIDAWHDEVTRAYLATCDDDSECAMRLGGDAVAFAESLLTRVAEGHCPDLADTPEEAVVGLKVTMGALISGSQARVGIPALLYRADRCEERDIEALGQLFTVVFGDAEAMPEAGLFSIVLAHHVTLSELWADPPRTAEELQAVADAALAHKNIGAQFGARQAIWPTYAPDAYHDMWAVTDVPLLMMNGTFDPQTRIETARNAGVAYDGPSQTFVEMPAVGHVTLTNSWIRPGMTCSLLLLDGFLRDPTAALDTSCVDQIDVLGFNPSMALVQALFGTDSLWD